MIPEATWIELGVGKKTFKFDQVRKNLEKSEKILEIFTSRYLEKEVRNERIDMNCKIYITYNALYLTKTVKDKVNCCITQISYLFLDSLTQ